MSDLRSQILEKIDGFGDAVTQMRDSLEGRIETLEASGDRPRGGGQTTAEEKSFVSYIKGDAGALRETKEMSIGGGAASGQAAVPELIADEIIEMALRQSQIAKKVRRTPVTSSDYVRLINLRGQSASWSSETGTRSATNTFEFRECRPTHGELYSMVTISNWLLNDSKFDLMGMIRENAAAQFAKALDAAIFNGDGSNKPTGIFNATPVSTADTDSPIRAAGAIQYIATGGTTSDDIIDLYFSLAPEYRANASFAMSSSVLGAVRQLRDTGGAFLWQQSLGSSMDAADGLLVGRPVATWEDMPSAYGNSPLDYPIVCGDFNAAYEVTEIGPMSVILDQVTVKGKSLIYLYQRFGGILTDNNAIKVIQA